MKRLRSMPHIGAVAQGREDRGIGGGPADAQLFQLADQAGFGIARRRLGEMLRRIDVLDLGRIACRDLGQLRAVFVGRVVLAFLIEGQEAVEQGDGAGGAQGDLACRRTSHRPWCVPARRFPSGWRRRASRSVRRAWPHRHRDSAPPLPACGRSWWGAPLHGLPGRSWPCWYRRAARRGT